MDLIEQVRNAYPSFSETRKRIAKAILDNPADCCFLSLRDFAHFTDTTEVTVLSFCKDLGIARYVDLRKKLQDYVMLWTKSADRLRRYSSLSKSAKELYEKVALVEKGSLEAAFSATNSPLLFSSISMIRKAKKVFIASHNASRIAANYLAYRFRTFGVEMSVLELEEQGQCIYRLASCQPQDILVFAIAVPPYGKPTIHVCELCKKVGIPVVSFTDSNLSPLVSLSSLSLVCPSSEFFGGLTNSFTPIMAMIEALTILYHYNEGEKMVEDECGIRAEAYQKTLENE